MVRWLGRATEVEARYNEEAMRASSMVFVILGGGRLQPPSRKWSTTPRPLRPVGRHDPMFYVAAAVGGATLRLSAPLHLDVRDVERSTGRSVTGTQSRGTWRRRARRTSTSSQPPLYAGQCLPEEDRRQKRGGLLPPNAGSGMRLCSWASRL